MDVSPCIDQPIRLAPEERTHEPRAALFALAVGSAALGTTEFLPSALLPLLSRDLKVSLSVAGLLVSGYALGVTLVSPILASVLSRVPRARAMVGLMTLLAVTNALAAFAPNYSFLLGIRFITAFSHGTYFAVASSTAASLVPPGRQARAIGTLFSGLTIAMATVVPISTYLGDQLGWRIPFGVAAAIAVAATMLIHRFVPNQTVPEVREKLISPLSVLRKGPILLALSVTTVGFTGIFAAYTYVSAILQRVSGFEPSATTLILALIGVSVTVGNMLGGRLADRNLYQGLTTAYGVLALCMAGFGAVASSKFGAAAATIPLGIFLFCASPGLQLLVLRQAKRWAPGAEAVAGGLNQSAFNLGIAAGAFLGGRVVDSSLGLRATPWVASLLLLVAIGLVAWSKRLDRRGVE